MTKIPEAMAPGIFSSYTKSCGRPQLFRCLSSTSSIYRQLKTKVVYLEN